MLARGTLVSYGTASTKDLPGDPRLPVLKLLLRLTAWRLLPNGRSASFFNIGAGAACAPSASRRGCVRTSAICSACWPTAGSAPRSRGASR